MPGLVLRLGVRAAGFPRTAAAAALLVAAVVAIHRVRDDAFPHAWWFSVVHAATGSALAALLLWIGQGGQRAAPGTPGPPDP